LQLHATGHCAVTWLARPGALRVELLERGTLCCQDRRLARASRSFELIDEYFIVSEQEPARRRGAPLARGLLLAAAMRMTTSAINDPPFETKAAAVIEPPGARKVQPEPAVPRTSSEPDLESRIRWRRAELIGKLRELRSEASLEVVQAGDRLKARLSELAHILKEGVVDGWASLGGSVKHKLERWLAESERSLSSPDLPARNGGS
jgi:hypothetical protein